MGNRSLHIYPGPDLVDGFRIVKSSSAFAAVRGGVVAPEERRV